MKNSIAPAAVLALAAIAMQGCTPPPPPPAPHLPIYATDLAGKAPVCTASSVKVVDGSENPATMSTGGGGWCAIVVNRGGEPFATSLLVTPPKNGKVYVHEVGDDTRIDYTPNPGAVAADTFAVRLIPGDAVIRVAVSPPTPPVGK